METTLSGMERPFKTTQLTLEERAFADALYTIRYDKGFNGVTAKEDTIADFCDSIRDDQLRCLNTIDSECGSVFERI